MDTADDKVGMNISLTRSALIKCLSSKQIHFALRNDDLRAVSDGNAVTFEMCIYSR